MIYTIQKLDESATEEFNEKSICLATAESNWGQSWTPFNIGNIPPYKGFPNKGDMF